MVTLYNEVFLVISRVSVELLSDVSGTVSVSIIREHNTHHINPWWQRQRHSETLGTNSTLTKEIAWEDLIVSSSSYGPSLGHHQWDTPITDINIKTAVFWDVTLVEVYYQITRYHITWINQVPQVVLRYSGGTWFESQLGHWASWLCWGVIFVSPHQAISKTVP
jgi:hypothetical protein